MTKGDVSSADAGADETANYDMGQHRGNRRTQAAELLWSDGSATHRKRLGLPLTGTVWSVWQGVSQVGKSPSGHFS